MAGLAERAKKLDERMERAEARADAANAARERRRANGAPPGAENRSADQTSRIKETLEGIRTGNDLRGMELSPVTWAVERLIPAGVTILGGKPKAKKSWMMLGIAIAVACGGKALGSIDVDPADVLYLSLEDGKRRLKRRVDILERRADLSRLHYATQWPRLHEGGTEALEAWLRSHSETRLVIIDTLAKVRPPGKQNETLYTNDYIVGELLIGLATRFDVAIVLIHHCRKLDAEDPIDLISGSLGLTGGVDGYMVLKRAVGERDLAFLTVVGRDLDEDQELAVKWHQPTATWHMQAGNAERYKLSHEQRAVIEALSEHGPMHTKDLAERLHPGTKISDTEQSREYKSTAKLCSKLAAKDMIHRRHYDKKWDVTNTQTPVVVVEEEEVVEAVEAVEVTGKGTDFYRCEGASTGTSTGYENSNIRSAATPARETSTASTGTTARAREPGDDDDLEEQP